MAISSYNVQLHVEGSTSGSFSKLVDIKEFPNLGGEPNNIETTTLSNNAQTFIAGIKQQDTMTFTANYTLADYEAVEAYADNATHKFRVLLGNDGTGDDGIFEWSGELSVYVNGAGVDEAVEMTISILPSTEVTLVSDDD